MERTDLIAAIHAAITASAGSIGISATIAADLAHQVEDRLRLSVAGEVMYVNKVDRTERARRLRTNFNGQNLKELAVAEGLTTRRVRQIVTGR